MITLRKVETKLTHASPTGAVLAAEREKMALEKAAADLDVLEEQYWHNFNDFQMQIQTHLHERDAMLARIDVACTQLEQLRGTNVYNETFHIW